MFKKIIHIALLAILVMANASLVTAQLDLEPDTSDLSSCVRECLDDETPNSRQIRRCENQCEEPEEEAEGEEIKENVLPPIPQPDLLPGPDLGENPTGEDVTNFIANRVLPKLASRLISITAVIAVLGIVVGGVMMIGATGNEEGIKKGRNVAVYSALALVLALLSFVIVDIINSLNLST